MKYIIDNGYEEVMVNAEELERFNRKIWKEHGQILYLDKVVQNTMYFGITDAE